MEFFLFASLMFLDTVIFMIMSIFYQYRPRIIQYEKLGMHEVDLNHDTVRLIGSNTEEGETIPLHDKCGLPVFDPDLFGSKKDKNNNP